MHLRGGEQRAEIRWMETLAARVVEVGDRDQVDAIRHGAREIVEVVGLDEGAPAPTIGEPESSADEVVVDFDEVARMSAVVTNGRTTP